MNFHNFGIIKIKLAIFICYILLEAHGLMNVCRMRFTTNYNRRCVSLLPILMSLLVRLFFGWCFNYLNTCIMYKVYQFSCPTKRNNKVRFILKFQIYSVLDYWMRRLKKKHKNKRNYIVSYQNTGELKQTKKKKNGLFHHSESTFLHATHRMLYLYKYHLSWSIFGWITV